ncbi:unnamed protein product [Adineta steineri]|uniref:F-box domain-containing protein n=1 Tax=Adineta steineri TaxID=433720 RepID=A0A813MD11_9BILA|nr:unnamed protein product [Adineta steineri]
MSVEQDSLFCILPVELIHLIFRHLDTQTIVHSFRLVCKRFHNMVDMYDEFDINFKSVLKSDFHYVCNVIPPENIKLLTLSDDDETPGQTECFLSRFHIEQFTKLRSLTLLEIDDRCLSMILKDVHRLELIELIIVSKEEFTKNNTIIDDLSSTVCLHTLRKLTLDIVDIDISEIVWSVECTLQHLEIHCDTCDAYCNILYHLPNLRTLVVERLCMANMNASMPELANPTSFHQLSSLTFKYCTINMLMLELLLSQTPALEHLRLMRCVYIRDFMSHLSQWQNFIETRLVSLSKFEFFLTETFQIVTTPAYIEQLIAPFRTTFWTETKRWFVICDYSTNSQHLMLYSSSMYDPQFRYNLESKRFSRSTSVPTIINTVIMDGIRNVYLNLSQKMFSVTSFQNNLPSAPMFTKVDYLRLTLNHNWPTYSLRVLSSLISLSYLTKISIETGEASDYDPNLMTNICSLLKLTPNVHSLKITRGMSTRDRDIKTFSLIPGHIRHLTVSVSTMTQMSKAIQNVGYRSSIKLYMDTSGDPSETAIQQFQHENEYYSYRLKRGSLSIWLDKNAYIAKQAANQNNIEQTDQDLETFSTFFIPNTK